VPQHILIWRNEQLTADASPEAAPAALEEPGALVWHDVQGNISDYTDELAALYHFTPLTIDSLDDENSRARLRKIDGYYHLAVHGITFDPENDTATLPQLDILFGRNFLVSTHCQPLDWLDEVRASATASQPSREADEHVMDRGVAYLLYVVLDSLVDSYFPVLDTLDDVIDELEDATVSDTSNAVQARLFRVKRTLAEMRRAISPQVEVCNALILRTGEDIPRDMEGNFAVVHDHMVRAFEVLDSYRDLMSGLLDVYLTTVSNRLNEVMKQLTIIATIFLPITFVTGVFGQNFGHSPQVESDSGINFWLVLLFMGLLTAAQLWYFRRRGWI
jgi:magnesium transporter